MYRSALWTLSLVASTVTACGPFAYVSNLGDGSVSVVNTSLNLEVENVSVGGTPVGVAVTPDGSKAYVGGLCVAVIDTSTSTVTENLCLDEPMTVVTASWGIAVRPDGARAYLTNASFPVEGTPRISTLSVLDVATDSEILRIPLGTTPSHVSDPEPFGLDVTPDGSLVYVAMADENVVRIFDTLTNVLKDEVVTVGSRPVGVAITPDGSHVYVTNSDDATVSVIATATNSVVATIPVGVSPRGVAIHPNGTAAYVANGGVDVDGSVSVIETDTNTVVDTVLVGANPYGIDVTPTKLFIAPGTFVYVANVSSNTLSVIDTATNTVVDSVTVGSLPVAFGKFIGPPVIPAALEETRTLRRLSMEFVARLEKAESDPGEAKRFARGLISRHGWELNGILSRDPELAREGFRLLGRFHGVLRSLLQGRPVRVGAPARREIRAWLRTMGARGSAELRAELAAFETALVEGGFPKKTARER